MASSKDGKLSNRRPIIYLFLRISLFVLGAVVGIILSFVYIVFPLEGRISFRFHSIQIKSSRIQNIWSKDRVVLGTTDGSIQIFPSKSGVILWGDIGLQGKRLLEFDAVTGSNKTILPSIEKPDNLLFQNDILYVSTSTGHISAFAENGSKIWENDTAKNNPLTWLYLNEQVLTVHDDIDGISVLDAGSGVKLYDFFMPCRGFWAVNSHSALTTCLTNGVELVSTPNYDPQWDYIFSTYIDQAPIVTTLPSRSLAIIKSSLPGVHRLFVLDMGSGEKLWETDSKFLSNVILYGNQVIGLTNEGFLKSYNLENGKSQLLLSFLPGNFALDWGAKRTFVVVGDASSKRVNVYLGDSLQLFAFEIEP